jgi:hypothetical protein
MSPLKNPELFEILIRKGVLKQRVYNNTLDAFGLIKGVITEMDSIYKEKHEKASEKVPFEITELGDFELHLKFAGDILIFNMHTNVFEFSRDHAVQKTPYVREDSERSYCGIINIYNFLADSFKYSRINDIGYLIGRMFINKDKAYFIEGKKELGLLYSNFGQESFNEGAAKSVVESAILYTINFDLLTPPYSSQKEVSVREMKSIIDSYTLKTGKRLGFRFQADDD